MSRLLKSGDASAQAQVAPFRSDRSPVAQPVYPHSPASPEMDAVQLVRRRAEAAPELLPRPSPPTAAHAVPTGFDQERRAFEDTIADLRQKLLESRDNADVREEAAYRRGAQEGSQAATVDDAKRSEMLREALQAMQEALDDQFADAEWLALQLARVALARVFGNCEDRAAQVADALRHRLEQVKRELVVAVSVSAEDFPAPENLADVTQDYSGISVQCDHNRPSGECLVRLSLGTLDIGIPGQWHRLCEFFDSLVAEERIA